MSDSIVSDIDKLVNSVNRLIECLSSETPEWMNAKQAYTRLGLSYQSFKSLEKAGIIRAHELHAAGCTRTLYNRDEIDQTILEL